MDNSKHTMMPIIWQRALIAYGLALGVSLFSNSVMWGHIDNLQHPYAFYLKCGLIGIIDFANFWLATWVVFGRSSRLRAYGFWFGLLLMVVMLIHTGALMKLESSKGENITMLKTVGDESAKIVESATKGIMTGAGESAIKANDEEQYKTSRAIRQDGIQSAANIGSEALKNLGDTASKLKPTTFLPQAYLDGAMYWALMVLAGILLAFGVKVSEEEGEGLIPDNLEQMVTGNSSSSFHSDSNSTANAQAPLGARTDRDSTNPVQSTAQSSTSRQSTNPPVYRSVVTPAPATPTLRWRGGRVVNDNSGNGTGRNSTSH
jgi:hypothetical protein